MVNTNYEVQAKKLRGKSDAHQTQALNIELNLQLIEMERAKTTEEDDE